MKALVPMSHRDVRSLCATMFSKSCARPIACTRPVQVICERYPTVQKIRYIGASPNRPLNKWCRAHSKYNQAVPNPLRPFVQRDFGKAPRRGQPDATSASAASKLDDLPVVMLLQQSAPNLAMIRGGSRTRERTVLT